MVRSSSSKPTKEKAIETARPSRTTKSTKAPAVKVSSAAQEEKSTKTKAKSTTKKSTNTIKETVSKKSDKKEPTTLRKSSTKSTSSHANKKSASIKSASPTPKTSQLFEESTTDADTPVVSILPALTDERLDSDDADIAAKTPPEFKQPEDLIEENASGVVAVQERPAEAPEVTFSYLGFSDQILEAIRKQNFDKPTRVQALCLPFTLDGKDVAGFAQTGTGKTAVYLLTAAHKLLTQDNRQTNPHKPQVLVIVPTRELADQVNQDAKRLLGVLKIKSLAVFGGVDVERHISELNQAVDLVVATPGRLLDLHRSKKLELDDLQLLVIDECDRMFDMGFIDDVEYILRHLPNERVQKLLFSATGSEKVKELAFEYLDEPEYIETDPVRITPERITQVAFAVTAEQKFNTLMGHIRTNNPECAIIFTNTKVVAEWVGYKLACNGLNAEVLTGDLPQKKRLTLIKKIKEGKCNLLVATDVLSRGLHVANLSHVYNFDVPDDAESFIHRIGRTARAGATGYAITLICDDYGYNMGAVEKLLGFNIPLTPVPDSYLAAEDKSDYPFDNTGRVKTFGISQSVASSDSSDEQVPPIGRPLPAEKREPRHHATPDRDSHRKERPESTLPAHVRRDSGHPVAEPRPSHPRTVQDVKKEAGPIAAAASPAAPLAKPAHGHGLDRPQPLSAAQRASMPAMQGSSETQRPTSTHSQRPTQAHARTQQNPQGAMAHRRDDKAKETIDLAIQAAKKAAARRQADAIPNAKTSPSLFKAGKTRVTEQIDEFAAAVLTGAQEKLGGAFDQIQDRFVSRLEENFPKLSETLVRLGFFSKRFTDDR